MIELRHLRYFLEAARLQHVTRAADALHITQSTLSHQLRQLEEDLGVALFDRVGRGVSLTQAGEAFVSYASRAVREVEEGRAAILELERVVHGRVRIGVIYTYNATLMPPVIADFAGRHPSIRIAVEDLPGADIEAQVANGDLDFGVAFSPAAREDIVAEPLFSERLMLVVRRDHRLAAAKHVPADRLADLDIAVQTERFSSRRRIDAAIGPWIAPRILLEMSSVEAMLNTVRLRGIAAIVFETAARNHADLACVPITRPDVARTAGLLWHRRRTRSPAARKLAEAIASLCAAGGVSR